MNGLAGFFILAKSESLVKPGFGRFDCRLKLVSFCFQMSGRMSEKSITMKLSNKPFQCKDAREKDRILNLLRFFQVPT